MAVWHLAISNLASRRARSLLLVAAVALATTLSVAIAAIAGTLGASFRMSLGRMAGLADMELRQTYGGYLDESVLNEVRAWPEVTTASARLEAGASLHDLTSGKTTSGLALGVDAAGEEALYPKDLSEGAWLDAPGDVVLDETLAKRLGAKVGDTIVTTSGVATDLIGGMADIMLGKTTFAPTPATQPGAPLSLRLVGLVRRPKLSVLQRPTAYVSLQVAQHLMGQPGKLQSIQIAVKAGPDPYAVVRAHMRHWHLPAGWEFQSQADASTGVRQALAAGRLMLLLIMAPGFLSAGFIIVTSLTTGVSERARELGILRSIGAARGQIAGAQLLSGAILAGAGGLAALPLGLLVAHFFYRHFMHELPSGFSPDWGVIGIAVGAAALTGLLAAIYPAARAAYVRPVEALANRASRPTARGMGVCLIAGLACISVEPLALLLLPLTDDQQIWFYLAAGLPLLFLGFFLLSVPALSLLAKLIAPVISALLRLPAGLLGQSAAATPYRHGFTGAAMMVGLAMLVAVWTGGRSVLGDWFARLQMPDGFVHSFFAMSEGQWQALRRVEGVAAACPTTMFPVAAQGTRGADAKERHNTRTLLVSLDPRAFVQMTNLTWVQGDPETAIAKLETGRTLLVSREYMESNHAGLGSHLSLWTAAGKLVDFEIVGVVSSPGLEVAVQFFGIRRYYEEAATDSVFTSRANAIDYFGNGNINLVLLKFKPGYSDDQVVAKIRRDVPGVIVGSSQSVRKIVNAVAEGFMRVVSALAMTTLVIACFGVGNLVLANLAVRQFEYGVLRAVGAQRWLLVRLVMGESILVALAGCVVGTALGLELARIAREMHRRLFGLVYGTHVPWDVVGYGCAVVIALALVASLPGLWRLVRLHPRVMLAGE